MLDPVALSQAGPVAILLVGIGLLGIGFVKGYVVPGWLYRQERDQRFKAEELAEANGKVLEQLASTVKAALDARRERP